MITVNAAELANAIKRVRHASPTDYNRPILSTILFEGRNETTIRLVAADNYRIAMQDVNVVTDKRDANDPGPNAGKEIGRTPVDIDDIKLLLVLLAMVRKGTVTLSLSDDKRRLVVGTAWRSVSLRVVDGTWPDYETMVVIPSFAKANNVAVQPAFLADTGRALGKHAGGMSIRFGDKHDPIVVDTKDGYMEMLMPIRVPDDR